MLNSNLLKNAVPSLVSHYWNYFKAAHRLWHGLKFTTFSEIWYSTLISALSLKTFSNWLLFRTEFVCQISFSINFLNLFLETQWSNSEPFYLFWLISTSQFRDKRYILSLRLFWTHCIHWSFVFGVIVFPEPFFIFHFWKNFGQGESVCVYQTLLYCLLFIYT